MSGDGQGSRAPRLLVVDDDDDGREATADLLISEGFLVDSASTAEGALRAMAERTYGVIILDVNMPGLTGVEALPRIRSFSPFTNVIMLTGYSSVINVAESIGNGAVDYFVKPIEDIVEFVRVIRELTKKMARWKRTLGVDLFDADGVNQ